MLGYALRSIQRGPALRVCSVVPKAKRWKSTAQMIASARAPTGSPLSSYVNEVGHANGIYTARKEYRSSLILPSATGLSFSMQLYRFHTWDQKYTSFLVQPIVPRTELVLMKHIHQRDVPLWCTSSALQKNQKPIIRSLGSKRLKNVLREVLVRHGFSLDGWPLGHTKKDEAEKKGPVLWGSIELHTYKPKELLAAPFQKIVDEVDRRYGKRLLEILKRDSAVPFSPGQYPVPQDEPGIKWPPQSKKRKGEPRQDQRQGRKSGLLPPRENQRGQN